MSRIRNGRKPAQNRWESGTGRVHFVDAIGRSTEYGTQIATPCGAGYIAEKGRWLDSDTPLTCRVCIRSRGADLGQWPLCSTATCRTRASYKIKGCVVGREDYACRPHLGRMISAGARYTPGGVLVERITI